MSKQGVKLPSARKTGTTIVGVIFNVSWRDDYFIENEIKLQDLTVQTSLIFAIILCSLYGRMRLKILL